jgi:hypothetical protein
MKRLLLAGASLLAVATSALPAYAQKFEFDYTGKLTSFTTPIKGTYQVIAFGAEGGASVVTPGHTPGAGGKGAEAAGTFDFNPDTTLTIAVGGPGDNGATVVIGGGIAPTGGGGGGGSFIVDSDGNPLVVAGGGGGGGASGGFGGIPGGGGLTTSAGGGNFYVAGGTNGSGGGAGCAAPIGGSAGGGGFKSAGQGCAPTPVGGGAFPTLAGGAGTANNGAGGFGGGGGAGAACGGGGGGYSGGAGGPNIGQEGCGIGGGGGGSILDETAADQILLADIRDGDGRVVIKLLAPVFAGSPGRHNCYGQSTAALAGEFGGLPSAARALGYRSVDALRDAIAEYCSG